METRSRKRKRSKNNDNDNNTKKLKNLEGTMFKINIDNDDNIDWNEWVAATTTKNYVLDDGILDVLKTKASVLTKVNRSYQDKFIKTIGNNSNNFVTSIMNQGNKFEKRIISLISENIGQKNIINIGGDRNPRSKAKYNETIKAMKKGFPIIYQGVLRNYTNKTYGIPDLLVRSDWLSKIITKSPLS